jgi:hypothetical protein
MRILEALFFVLKSMVADVLMPSQPIPPRELPLMSSFRTCPELSKTLILLQTNRIKI